LFEGGAAREQRERQANEKKLGGFRMKAAKRKPVGAIH